MTIRKYQVKKIVLLVCFTFSVSAFGYITHDPNDPNIKAVCRDGSYSTSKGRGTCSHHGGVDHYL
ncbi:TPA: DUF3761 domain-containing protein [Morganella morganii]|nr:DUF3761 domain-containing protein [Morganella morganii]MBT0390019.1 DUF3761 domain-containing protein [Morganella morganii subsp. morganii]ELF0883497.1 DUF3761 domain-containing protein [Morganella morganii]ELN8406661.1 DUF3761 domain-containing protein [Morganella morganii]MBC4004134.1 DUF3761 domain-containing protein [Morganella morganii]